ncbi:MAG: phosphatase [Gemmatimonadetes bacterium]|nr:phosphatase [Gemmatimonadota bacterium]
MPGSAPLRSSYVLPDHGLAAGEYPFSYDSARAAAKLATVLDAGITCFIDLTTPEDLLDRYDGELTQQAAARGLAVRHVRLGITDMDVPSPAHMARILDAIDDALARGERPYVHCWGGAGRTGTVIGCFLVRHGMSGAAALAEVAGLAAHYCESPQTLEQCEFVRNWTEPGAAATPPAP